MMNTDNRATFKAGTPLRNSAARAPIRLPSPGTIARFLVVLVIAAVMALPVYVTFISALSPNGELARDGIIPNVTHFTLDNFAQAADSIPLAQEYLVSIGVVSLQTIAQILTGALAAYALVFPRWRGRGVAFGLVLLSLAIPGESLVIPNYELVSSLGFRNTIMGVTLPFLAAGYAIFLLRQAFAAVPTEIWEAAKIDGCGDLRALFAVVMPSCRPQVTTAVMWSALAAWNGFFWPLLITDSAEARTIQVGLSQLVTSEGASPAVIFAGTALVVVPTIVLVIAAQRFLVNGLSRGVLR